MWDFSSSSSTPASRSCSTSPSCSSYVSSPTHPHPQNPSLLTHKIDRQNLLPSPNPLRRPQGRPPRLRQHAHLGHPRHPPPIPRLQHRPGRPPLLQARRRPDQGVFLSSRPRVAGIRGAETRVEEVV